MKKVINLLVISSIILLTACGETKVAITAKDAETNEVILDSNNKVQVAIRESFDKGYYSKEDLEKYIKDDVSTFNSNNGTNISYNSMKVKDGEVYVVMDYPKVQDYNAYEEYNLTTAKGSGAKDCEYIPSTLKVYGKDKNISKSEVLKESGVKVAVLSAKKDNEGTSTNVETNFTVAGKIKYAANAKKVDNNTVKVTSIKEPVVVIYK